MRDLKTMDAAITGVVILSADTSVLAAKKRLEESQASAAAVCQNGQWYYILAADLKDVHAEFCNLLKGPVDVQPADFSTKSFAEEANYLSQKHVLVFYGGSTLLFTPQTVMSNLLRLYSMQHARLQSVMDTVGEAVCVIDENDQVVGWNRRAEQLYGIKSGEIIRQPLEQFFPDSLLAKVMKERQAVKDKYYRPRPATHVIFTANAIKHETQIIGALCAERDITEIVQLNQELSRASMEVQSLKEEIDKITFQEDAFSAVCGHSVSIMEAVKMARKVAVANVPVLLRGESGTGKEVFARAIHKASRRSGPFVEINCGAIPINLFESELFGYQPGAFTGADRKGKQGLMEAAHLGTLFLDELGDLPKETQVKLLRAIEEKSFYRVGGDKPVKVDVRVIAATHRNLEEMIAQREFREDLYYRLNVVSLHLTPLRERREDIPELVHRAVRHFGALHAKAISRIEPAVMAVILDYHWPGNIRELYNVLERMVILAEGDTISPQNLPVSLIAAAGVNSQVKEAAKLGLNRATDSLEKEMIEGALQDTGFKKAAAAKKLGIPRSTLYYKMEQLGIKC